eukprot:1154081-Pelagomonas_calceolata.AAC.23
MLMGIQLQNLAVRFTDFKKGPAATIDCSTWGICWADRLGAGTCQHTEAKTESSTLKNQGYRRG